MPLQRPDHCSTCVMLDDPDKPLCAGFMRPTGQGVNKVLVIAEALGKHEYEEGRPLVEKAAAGSVFQRAIDKLGVSRESFTIANMIWGQPKGNKLEGEWYESQAIEQCSHYLKELIERTNPRAILALGNVPLRYLTGNTGKDRTVSSLRGYPLTGIGVARGLPVIPSYHPAFLARGQEKYLGVLIHDIGRAIAVARAPLIPTHVATRACDCTMAEQGEHYPPNPKCVACKGSGVVKIRIPDQWQSNQELKGAWINIDGVELGDLPQLKYVYNPSEGLVRDWLARAQANQRLVISTDVETDFTKKGNKNEEEYGAGSGWNIQQIQFCHTKNEAIILPWDSRAVELTKIVMGMPNAKLGQNFWRYDSPRMRRAGIEVKGDVHDAMVAWHILQPDLPADLQFVASMHYFPFAWKYLGVESVIYGGADVDAPLYIWDRLPTAMQNRGVWQAYLEYFKGDFQDTLDGMQQRGIYIDLRERDRFKKEVEQEKVRINNWLQDTVPVELKPINPPQGYKVWPASIREALAIHPSVALVPKTKQPGAMKALAGSDSFINACLKFGYRFKEFGGEYRPYEQLDFLPQSPNHLKTIIKHYGVKVPLNLDDDETTAKTELERLIEKLRKQANELVVKAENPKARKGEEFVAKAQGFSKLAEILENSILYRQYNKIAATYIDGWKVGENALVHTTYTHRSASWQLTSVEPNVQNAPKHGRLAKPFLKTLASRPGHTLINFDMKACHMLTMAFEAQDKSYERAARIDGHSILAANILNLPGCKYLLEKPDDELKDYIKWFRADPARNKLRNGAAKQTLLGNQLGLGATKLYDMNLEHFKSTSEAKKLQKLLDDMFPKVTAWKKYIKKLAAKQGFLQSRYGGIRWFWSMVRWNAHDQEWELGDDGEAALAFNIQQNAFGKMREAMLDIHADGFDEDYWMTNTVHDSLEFDCPDHLVEQCIKDVSWIMRKPAKKLVHPTLWPNGLCFDVEVHVGKNKAPFDEITNPGGMVEVKV